MPISGSYLPSPAAYSGRADSQSLTDYRPPATPRQLDTEQKNNRQQTVEYVFKGELLEQISADQQQRKRNPQSIDPANQGAISSYTRTAEATAQQGRLLDIFI
ncbi:MAG: hypothetical protein H8E21_08675 [Gammaproteobacteria bacterium]|nr:hypothetical protein [Gammaproteobacteria bacterium]MBL6999849.1 hypothetical protein [Gammaproteobacteria bacterium]